MSWQGATCRSCGEPVIWTVTEEGKRMPVDRDPPANGNLFLESARDGDGRVEYRSRVVKPEEEPERPRYLSHFATCPQRTAWRRPRASAR